MNNKSSKVILALVILIIASVIAYLIITIKLPWNIEKIIKNNFENEVQLNGIEPDSVFIISDVTGSMRGYTSAAYYNLFINLNARIANEKVAYYSLNENLNKICTGSEPAKLDYFLNSKNYKSRKIDYGKIKELLSRSENSAVLFLTDMQYNSNEQRLINEKQFKNYFNENFLLKFYSTELDYEGNVFYLVSNKEDSVKYKGLRPFYSVLIANKAQHLDYFDKIFNENKLNKFALTYIRNTESKIKLIKNHSTEGFESQGNWKYEGQQQNEKICFFRILNPDTASFRFELENQLFKEWSNFDSNNFQITAYDVKVNIKDTMKVVANDTVFVNMKDTVLVKSPEKFNFYVTNINLEGDKLFLKIKTDKIIKNEKVIRLSVIPDIYPLWVNNFNCEETDSVEILKNHTSNLNNLFINMTASNPFVLTNAYIYIK